MPEPPTPTRVWIVEDERDYREALGLLVGLAGGLEAAGAFGSAEEVLLAADAVRPDAAPHLVLLDVNLPGRTGIEAAPRLRALLPEARLVMLTVRDDPDTVHDALRAGASGYLLKGAPLDVILSALRETLAGGMLMPAPVARRVLAFFQAAPLPGAAGGYGLSERERDVLRLMADGLTQKEIGDALFISPSTVNGHVQRIYEKLHVHTAPGAVAKALRERLV